MPETKKAEARLFINLKAMKMLDDGAGGFEGYGSVFGNVDSYGDVIVKGAYADTLDSFKRDGFIACDHEWEYKGGVIGYVTEAFEDDYGLFIRTQFHSTPDAQEIRVKMRERMAAGKTVGLSIGYSVARQGALYVPVAKAMEYIRAEHLAAAQEYFSRYPDAEIRILLKINLFETSVVTRAANRAAMATAIKSSGESDDFTEELLRLMKADEGLPVGLSFADHSKAALAALSGWLKRANELHELRLKEGRVLSATNRALVQECVDCCVEARSAMEGAINVMTNLLAATDPNKSEDNAETEELYAHYLKTSLELDLMGVPQQA